VHVPDNDIDIFRFCSIHYTNVLKNDQLAANPVPNAAPTMAGLIPATSSVSINDLKNLNVPVAL
jgi:hypothetical protein